MASRPVKGKFRVSLGATILPSDNALSSKGIHLTLLTTTALKVGEAAIFCIYPHVYSYLLRVYYGHFV